MIDITTYRQRIGRYTSGKHNIGGDNSLFAGLLNKSRFRSGGFCIRGGLRFAPSGAVRSVESLEFNASDSLGITLGHLVYIYYVLLMLLSIPCILLSTQYKNYCCVVDVLPSLLPTYSFRGLPSVAWVHIRIAYFIFVSYLLNKSVRGQGPLFKNNKLLSPSKIIFKNLLTNRLRQAIASVLIFIALLNFLMIAIYEYQSAQSWA